MAHATQAAAGQDAAHRIGAKWLMLDIAPAVHLAEHRAELAAGGLQPGFQRAHRAGLPPLAAAEAELDALAFLVGLGGGQQDPQPGFGEAQVLAVDPDQLGPPQRPGEADQQQGAVAQPCGVAAAGRD